MSQALTVTPPKLSIVVTSPSMNRIGDIKQLIDSLSSQTESRIELVFVAEASEVLLDEVRNHAKDSGLGGQFIMSSGPRGLAQGRNLGLEVSRADIVAMVDDDVVLPPEWAETVLSTFVDAGVVGMTGPALPLWENSEMSWLPKEFYWLISCTEWYEPRNPRDVRSAWGMNMAFRREALIRVGGLLDSSGYHKPIAEDLELSMRVRALTHMRIVFNKKAFVWHKVHTYRLNWMYLNERSLHIGASRRIMRKVFKVKYDREQDTLRSTFRRLPQLVRSGKPFDGVKLALFVYFNVLRGYLSALWMPSRDQVAFEAELKAKWSDTMSHNSS